MIPPDWKAQDWKRWLAIGTGVGIEVHHDELQVTVVRVRPSGVSVLGSLELRRFKEQPAAEWGDVYNQFLRKLGQRHLAAQVLLPREAVIVRQLSLPGVSDKDLAAAIRFQVDSLHPYAEDDVAYDFTRVGKSAAVLVGIARRSVVDEYSTLFAEAGVKISAFTLSAASLYSAVRLLNAPPADGFLAFSQEEGEFEAYGESPSRPIFSTRLDVPLERARALSLAELRLPPETVPAALTDILPVPSEIPDEYDLPRATLVYATALAGAIPWFASGLNLLPKDQRQTSSRLIYVPTIVLAALVVLLTVALSAYSNFEDKRYLAKLQIQIRQIQPHAQQSADLDRKIQITRNRAQALDNFRRHLKDDMTAVNDLSNLLPPPSWLNSLQLTRDSASISGEAPQAEGLLKLLDGSKQFRRSEFTLPISRGGTGEAFSIHSVREGVTP